MFRLAFLLALSFAAAAGASPRSPLRVWTDEAGVTHVDDTPPPPKVLRSGRTGDPPRPKAGRSAATPAKAKARASRWWERATDAPPDEIDRAAATYNIPAELVRAVIAAESAGQAEAVSHKGAVGLMQLMPGTARRMYVQDAVDPAQNIQGGTRYLRTLANEFNGDMMLVVAAYNAGPEAVRRYGGVPPFEETRGYVRKVMNYYRELKAQAAKSGTKVASTEPRPAKAAGGLP